VPSIGWYVKIQKKNCKKEFECTKSNLISEQETMNHFALTLTAHNYNNKALSAATDATGLTQVV
jgi:hypothetical protein